MSVPRPVPAPARTLAGAIGAPEDRLERQAEPNVTGVSIVDVPSSARPLRAFDEWAQNLSRG